MKLIYFINQFIFFLFTQSTTSKDINGVILQSFEWYLPNDTLHYTKLTKAIPTFKNLGISAIWLPPSGKGAAGTNDVGYGIYDGYDLGEFQQKGTIATKYGTYQQLINLSNKLNEYGIHIYADMVYNHRIEGDQIENFKVIKVDPNNRLRDISGNLDASAKTQFLFNGRKDKYSNFKYYNYHFVGLDYNRLTNENGVFRIIGDNKYWSLNVDNEFGNYDYLLGFDIDLKHPDVQDELIKWTVWLTKQLQLKGIRIDAAKHIHSPFINLVSNKLINMDSSYFFVGEYWTGDMLKLNQFIKDTQGKIHLFDVPFHFNLFEASIKKENYDMRNIFKNTLVGTNPVLAVTFVDNHDTQPGQALQSYIERWFKPHAYSLILLRSLGYPCVFYGDLYGISNGPSPQPSLNQILEPLLLARRYHAYGEQVDYFDHPSTVGWIRTGTPQNGATQPGLAIVLSIGLDGFKTMRFPIEFKGRIMIDLFNKDNMVTIGGNGEAIFNVQSKKVAVFVPKEDLNLYSK